MVKLETIATKRAMELQPPPAKGNPYAVALPGSKQDGRSEVYRHWRFVDGLLETLDPAITTGHDAFEHAALNVPKNKCLGYRPYDEKTQKWGAYVWIDYQTVHERRKNLGAGIVHLLRKYNAPEDRKGLGLWCQNRPEWQIADLAAMSQGLYTVSLYETLGPDTSEFIINDAQLNLVICSVNHIATLVKIKQSAPDFTIIICVDEVEETGELAGTSKKDILRAITSNAGLGLYFMSEVEELGKKFPRPYHPPTPNDFITINYTSGTTGNPKGVMLTHRAATAAVAGSATLMKQTDEDVICSFMPLAHIFQRMNEQVALSAGAGIGYFHGVIPDIVDDLKMVRPTVFAGVPRLFNRFGTRITEATFGSMLPWRRAIARQATSTKLANINDPNLATQRNTHALWDRLFFSKVAAQVGLQRAHTVISGSAPLDPQLHQFLRVCLYTNFGQGYGLTETFASTLCQLEGDFTSGNCGGPLPGVEACLRDVPDMEYLSTDLPRPRGELMIRGPILMSGYWRNPEKTAEAMTEDGWFCTGDIAEVDNMGRFYIIDRRKELMKLAQGEYISPEKIENVILSELGYLQSAYVHGESDKAFVVGMFGIEPEGFAPWASKITGKKFTMHDVAAMKEACKDPRVIKEAMKDLQHVSKTHKLNRWEWCKGAHLAVDPFTEDNGLLTPTMKLKRTQVKKVYKQELDTLYALADATSSKVKARL